METRKTRKLYGRRAREAAQRAVDAYLRANRHVRYFMAYTLSIVADEAAGRELYSSLYDYLDLFPGEKAWIPASELDERTFARGLGGDFLVVENPYFSPSHS